MTSGATGGVEGCTLSVDQLGRLLSALRSDGYRLVGPKLAANAIVYDELQSLDELPRGWTDEQGPGHYRLRSRSDDALFGYAVGPHSWKQFSTWLTSGCSRCA